jgi:ABC-2 type transport system permease protein
MADIVTIIAKELKEYWKARGSLRARLISFLPLLIIFGIYFPLQQREMWAEAPFVPGMYFMWLPFVLAGGTAADSFAGERERHTLETLLATRLSDRDIFLGKVLAVTIYSLGVTWAAAVLALITLNVTRGGGPFYMFGASALALIVVGGLLFGLLMTAIGVLASLRAASVRAAAQWFSVMTLVLFIGGPLVLQALPAPIRDAIGRALETANLTAVGIAAALAVLAVDVALLAVGIARFQRTRLILEE